MWCCLSQLLFFFYVCVSPSGTEKVRQAQGCKHLHVVNPDWLWACLERWERVEERLFPLKEDFNKSYRYLSLTVSLSLLLWLSCFSLSLVHVHLSALEIEKIVILYYIYSILSCLLNVSLCLNCTHWTATLMNGKWQNLAKTSSSLYWLLQY